MRLSILALLLSALLSIVGMLGFVSGVMVCPPVVEPDCAEMTSVYWEVREGKKPIGSCVALSYAGETYFLTAAHVAGENKVMELYKECDGPDSFRTIKVDVIAVGNPEAGPDLALFKPRDAGTIPTARFNPLLKLREGEPAWYVGTPMGFHRSFERTIINNPHVRAGIEDDKLWDHISVNGNGTFGNSGGPVFVRRGWHYTLAGIFTLKSRSTVNFAEGPDAIERFLRMR